MPGEGRQNALPRLEEREKKKKAEVFIKLSSLLSWNNYSTPLSPAAAGAGGAGAQGEEAKAAGGRLRKHKSAEQAQIWLLRARREVMG